jgi:hypothetical protein
LLLVNDNPYGAFVRCRLTAGADSDAAYVVLEEPNPAFPGSWGGASAVVMNLQVVHGFDTPGVVVLSCADGFPVLFGDQPGDGPAQFRHLKITAMKVSSISNVLLLGD